MAQKTLVNPGDDSTIRQEKKLLLGLNPKALRYGQRDEIGKERDRLSPKEREGKGERKATSDTRAMLRTRPLQRATAKRNPLSFCNRQAFGWL